MPEFADIPKREFETTASGRMGKTGTLHNMAGQLCGTSYAIQYMDQFTTEPKGEAGDGDLFGDSGNPQITLVGTSQQRQELQLRRLPGAGNRCRHSQRGLPRRWPGRFDDPVPGQRRIPEDPPKILIWEFSPLYRLDQETIYRQMMSLLDNGCEGKTAQMTASTTLKPGKNELMVNSSNKDLRNANHQVDIHFADPSVKTLASHPLVHERAHEDIEIEKPETSDTDGRFAFELRTDEDSGLAELAGRGSAGPRSAALPRRRSKRKFAHATSFPSGGQKTASLGQSSYLLQKLWIPSLLGLAIFAGSGQRRRPTASAQGYFAPIEAFKTGDFKENSDAMPTPYTGPLQFRSRLEGSDKARSTLNVQSEKAFRDSTADITKLKKTPANA